MYRHAYNVHAHIRAQHATTATADAPQLPWSRRGGTLGHWSVQQKPSTTTRPLSPCGGAARLRRRRGRRITCSCPLRSRSVARLALSRSSWFEQCLTMDARLGATCLYVRTSQQALTLKYPCVQFTSKLLLVCVASIVVARCSFWHTHSRSFPLWGLRAPDTAFLPGPLYLSSFSSSAARVCPPTCPGLALSPSSSSPSPWSLGLLARPPQP